ncbi:amidohydrolase family protein [Candidatus Hydrogenedentota bacterium]
MLKSTDTYQELKQSIDETPLSDCHEHLAFETDLINQEFDFWGPLLQYTVDDLNSALGAFDPDYVFRSGKLSEEERWEFFKARYDRCRNTGYLQALRMTCRALFGVEPDSLESMRKIDEEAKKLRKPGILKHLVKEVANVDVAIVVRSFDSPEDPPFIKRIIMFNEQILFSHTDCLREMEKQTGVRVHRLQHLEEHYRRWIDMCVERGAVGFKTPIAYIRPINFPKPTSAEAEQLLQRVIDFTKAPWMSGEPLSVEEATPLTNYAMHLFLEILDEKKLPVSFHTGIQARGRNDIRKTNPSQLINLFNEYPDVRFDLFHGGYPYGHEWVELAKTWPNVYLNFCWVNSISPHNARELLAEALECVPINKIFAFGGDVGRPELVVGMAQQARENVALVLAEKVELGIFSMEEAKDYGEHILRTNAREMWNLD